MALPIKKSTAEGLEAFPRTVKGVVVSLPDHMTVLLMTSWSSATLEAGAGALDGARSLLCAERDVFNTVFSLDPESLDVSPSRVLNGGLSSLRGLDGGSSSRGLDGGSSSKGLDGGGMFLLSA
jgi:hypothetical protein